MSRLALCFVATLLVSWSLSAAPPPERVVAIGDIHGEYEGFVSILQKAGLIDAKLRWTGGRTTFVQTGDFLDRGPDVRKVMDLLMNLERAASRSRGRVIVLLGNHELMNLTSALHDASPAQYAAFADRNSEKRRKTAYAQYLELHARLTRRYGEEPWRLLDEEAWMERHPAGFIEFQEALSRNGKYGRWLRSKPALAKVGDTVFLHGGISPKGAERTLEQTNAQVRLEMEGFDRIREYLVAEKLILPFFTYPEMLAVVNAELAREGEKADDLQKVLSAFKSLMYWTIYDPEGPLWFRGFGEWSDEEGEELLTPILQRFGAKRFVVGHTILNDGRGIVARFGGRVFLIDTGMLRNYAKEGRPAALELSGGRSAAIYETGRVSLDGDAPRSSGRHEGRARPVLIASLGEIPVTPAPQWVWLGPDGTTLPFRTEAEVAEFLRASKVRKVHKKRLYGVTKPQKLLVQNGNVRANAVFRSHHREEENSHWESGKFTEFLRDTYLSEVAAYQLSLLLGLDHVPPTVPWEMKGQKGSLQLWIEKARPGWHPNDVEKPSDPGRWESECAKMAVFDALIANTDRHENNMLVDSTGKVWWIDHSRSFGRERDLLDPEAVQRCERTFWETLKKVDPTQVTETLKPYMSPLEIEALLERRQKLIALIERLIAERGEDAVLFTIGPGTLKSIRPAA